MLGDQAVDSDVRFDRLLSCVFSWGRCSSRSVILCTGGVSWPGVFSHPRIHVLAINDTSAYSDLRFGICD